MPTDDETPQMVNAPVFHDDLSAPTIIIDGICGVISTSGIIVVSCSQTKLHVQENGEMKPTNAVNLRLAIPTGEFPKITHFFQTQHELLKKDGIYSATEEPEYDDSAPKNQ
jgi:hypothetical protein